MSEGHKGDKPFFLRSRGDLPTLEKWLQGRNFNCGCRIGDDKKGNPMLSIAYDRKPDSDWHMPDKRGLIIVTAKNDDSLWVDVEAMINRIAAND